ncbi:hypothetical protein LLB_3541 [Legionella longbeachae D-4968]|nr:hypothetical protein LLB_3541 [Legionella longbeachae D-4968]
MLPSATILATYAIEIVQKANRKKRQVMLELKPAPVTFLPSERTGKAAWPSIWKG